MTYSPQSGGWPDPSMPQPDPSGVPPPGASPGHPPPPPGYGYPPPNPGYPPYGYPPPRTTNGLAIAALVCSLSGLAVGLSAPVGAILGHVARKQIRERDEDGDGMALAGIIVGWIITGLFVLGCGAYIAFVVWAINVSGSSSSL